MAERSKACALERGKNEEKNLQGLANLEGFGGKQILRKSKRKV